MRRGACALSCGAFALLWLVAGFPLVPAAAAATARRRIADSAVSIQLVETQRLPKEALHATPQPCLPGAWVPGTDDFLIAGAHRFNASGPRKLFLWNTRTHRVTQVINVPAIVKILNKGLGGRKDFAARGRAKPRRSNGWGLVGCNSAGVNSSPYSKIRLGMPQSEISHSKLHLVSRRQTGAPILLEQTMTGRRYVCLPGGCSGSHSSWLGIRWQATHAKLNQICLGTGAES